MHGRQRRPEINLRTAMMERYGQILERLKRATMPKMRDAVREQQPSAQGRVRERS